MGQRLTLPLLFLAALLAGGAFFWMTGDERGSGAPVGQSESQPAADEAAPVELAEPAVLTAPPGQESAQGPARVAVAESAPQESHAHSQDGEGVGLQGLVVDRFGTPVAGARVTVANDVGFALDLQLAQEFDWLDRKRTETDAEGRFHFEGVRPGTLQIGVRASGFAPYTARGVSLAASATELEPIELARGAILTGIVVDHNGRGVAKAELVPQDTDAGAGFFMSGSREAIAVSGPDGRFRIDELACGAWRFLVRTEDHPSRSFEGLAEEPGVEVGGLSWELAPGATIAGTVTGVPASERAQLSVRATRGGGEDFFSSARKAEVAANGAFVLRGLRVDENYTLRARHTQREQQFSMWERSRSTSVTARAGDSGVVLAYQPEAALVFKVVDGTTQLPIENFQVQSGTDWTVPLMDDRGRQREVFPGGEVRVGGLRPASDQERVLLRVTATGYRDFERAGIAVRAGQEIDLGTVFLDPVPVVRVHVTEQVTGKPVAGATVSLQKQGPSGEMSVRHSISIDDHEGHQSIEFGEGRSARTDSEGWAELTSFEGATASLSVKAKGYARAKFEGLFLPAGKDFEQQVSLSLGGEVLVKVLDSEGQALPGARIEQRVAEGDGGGMMENRVMILGGGGGGGGGRVTDSEGVALFENLAGGVHSFRIGDGSGGGSMWASADSIMVADMGGDSGDDWTQVQVLEGERADLTLRAKPIGGLAGRVREAGKILAGATLRLEKETAEERGPAMRFPGMGGGADQTRSDGDGRYRLSDVKAGDYKLVVEHPTRRMPQEFLVEVREGENTFDVELPVSILSGRITNDKGLGVSGVRVTPARPSGGGGRQAFRMVMVMDDGDGTTVETGGGFGEPAVTDEDGRYELRGVASDVDLVVKAEGDDVQPGESEIVRVAPNEVREGVDLSLDPAGTVRVEAALADGTPARMQIVQASYLGDGEDRPEPKFGFLQRGSTELTGLKPGLWKVSVRSPQGGMMSGNSGSSGGQEQEIEVVAGEQTTAEFEVE